MRLVDAVPDWTFLLLARIEAIRSPATRGVPAFVTEIRTGATRVGRFGWKAQVPTLHQFSGAAYLNEMGVTSAEFPDESCPQGDCAALAFNPVPTLNNDGSDVDRFTDFMTLLGPPPRGRLTFVVASCTWMGPRLASPLLARWAREDRGAGDHRSRGSGGAVARALLRPGSRPARTLARVPRHTLERDDVGTTRSQDDTSARSASK